MQVGLYTQMFGWHLLLFQNGALYRLLRNGTRRTEVDLAVVTALLVLTHSLTAAFGFFLAGLAWLRFSGARLAIARSQVLGVALSAFWLVPCLTHSAAYTIDVVEPSANDLLGLLVRYPLTDSLRALTLTASGHFIAFDPTGLFLGLLLLAALASRAVRACQLLSSFLVFGLISSVFFSSELIAASIPLPLHYYRFRASEVLLFVALLSVIPVVLVHQMASSAGGQRWLGVARSGILAACLLSVLLNLLLPHFGHVMLERMDLRTRFAHEGELLDFFGARPLKGRVLFEHFQDRELFAPITPHDLPSRLARTRFETVNGLFVQSSLANRLLLGPAQRLGITVYGATSLTREGIGRNDAAEVARLRALGVTHVVLTQRDSIERLTPYVIDPTVTIGPYNVMTIAPSPPTLVQCVQRPLVGYVDHAGTLPFKLFEAYWLSRLDFAFALDLVALDSAAQPPTGLSTLIVNGTAPDGARIPLGGESGAVPVLSLNFDPPFPFDHYRPRRMPHGDAQAAQQVSRYLDARLDLDALRRLSMEPDVLCDATERLQWDDDHQGFRIEGMHPGRMVRINYTYFPYWHTDDGALFRGAAERLYYDPAASTASFTYTRNPSFPTWLGVGLSLAAAAVLAFGLRYRLEGRHRPRRVARW